MNNANPKIDENTSKEEIEKLQEQYKPGQQKSDIKIPKVDPENVKNNEGAAGKTMGSMIGDIVWLMSQSPAHKYLSLADLEWALMPPIILGQYKVFRDGKKPVGAALWGYLSAEAEEKLKTAGRLSPQDWGNNAQLDPARGLVPREGGTLWLVELITPFHTEQNKHREQMLGDLVNTVFKGKQFKLMHVNPETKKKEVVELEGKK